MRIILFIFTLLQINCLLASEVSISKYFLTFENNENTKQSVRLINNGKNKAFIEVVLEEVVLENNELKFKPVEVNENSLIATPNKIILQPNEKINSEKNVNFVNLNKDIKKEKIYRASYYPRLPKDYNNEKKLAVNILIVYETYIYVTPKVIIQDYNIERKEDYIIFKNNGNSKIKLIKGKTCVEKECEIIKNKIVLAGQEIKIPASKDASLYYTMDFGNEKVKELKFK